MGPKLTQAEGMILGTAAKMFTCCGARCAPWRRRACVAHHPFVVPGSFLAANGCVICRPRHTLYPRCICHRQRSGSRPRPLAQVASSATGGAPIAPHRRPGDRVRHFGKCSVWHDLLDNNFVLTNRLDQSVKPFDDFFAMLNLTDLHKGEFLL